VATRTRSGLRGTDDELSLVLGALARKYGRDPDTEDAFQDVIVKLLQMERLDHASHRGYVATAVRHQLLNNARPRRRDEPLDDADVSWPHAPDVLSDRITAGEIAQVLAAVSAKYATAFRMRIEGCDGQEIAAAVDVEYATVRQWFARTLPSLVADRTGIAIDLGARTGREQSRTSTRSTARTGPCSRTS
jgi:RNA polymerase sigma factor (sigma-70 family)